MFFPVFPLTRFLTMNTAPTNTLLGKATEYVDTYQPKLLTPIPRYLGRGALAGNVPFKGVDIWRLYEVTWLNEYGLPQAAAGEIHVPAASPSIVESKSLKLYIGSLTQSVFPSLSTVENIIARDVGQVVGETVTVKLFPIGQWHQSAVDFEGVVLEEEYSGDRLFRDYEVNPALLAHAPATVTVKETLVSHLLRSRCPVTGQPDFASVRIEYEGAKIDHTALLAYIVSYRRHQGFHEQCVESIYTDIMLRLKPASLSVYGAFTRRGGIDISPFRSTTLTAPEAVIRVSRQ